jgi:hypothetical protein
VLASGGQRFVLKNNEGKRRVVSARRFPAIKGELLGVSSGGSNGGV